MHPHPMETHMDLPTHKILRSFTTNITILKNETCLLDRAVNIKEQNRCLTMIGKFCVEETQFILGTNCIHCIQNLLFIECKCTPGFWHVHVRAENEF